jgi:hypothetical protein
MTNDLMASAIASASRESNSIGLLFDPMLPHCRL